VCLAGRQGGPEATVVFFMGFGESPGVPSFVVGSSVQQPICPCDDSVPAIYMQVPLKKKLYAGVPYNNIIICSFDL
jgi:hypothetical protein